MGNAEQLEERLRELDFSEEEINYYIKLTDAGQCSCSKRLQMLMDKRKGTLDEIHRLEEQIICMDVMRQEIKKKI